MSMTWMQCIHKAEENALQHLTCTQLERPEQRKADTGCTRQLP